MREFVAAEQAKLDQLVAGTGSEDASALRLEMQQIMTDKVGIFRTGDELAAAVSQLQALLERSRHIGLRHKAGGANPELVTAYRVQKMLKLALCMAHGAAARTESRGAHFRADFPRRDDASWLKRTLATWRSDDDLLPTLAYEPLDVSTMELPPGWRGYGAKDYIEHPRHAAARGRGGRLARAAGRRVAPRGAAGPDALRSAATRHAARPQRTHRRAPAMIIPIVPADAARKGAVANGGTAATTPRRLSVRILRFNPQQPDIAAHWQSYEIDDAPGMTLFIALTEIREKLDPSLQFDFVCRAGICGSCAMLVDGRPALACRTLTKNLAAEFTLAPLPVFELIGDLSVDTGKWMRGMSERLQTWVHQQENEPDLRRLEARMEPELAEKIYELDRCIECGCCVAACGSARMREDFVGAVGLNKIARFRLDPRDTRDDDRLLRTGRRRRRCLRLHVAAGLPRRLPQGPAAADAAGLRAPQDGGAGLALKADTASINHRMGAPNDPSRSRAEAAGRTAAEGAFAPVGPGR